MFNDAGSWSLRQIPTTFESVFLSEADTVESTDGAGSDETPEVLNPYRITVPNSDTVGITKLGIRRGSGIRLVKGARIQIHKPVPQEDLVCRQPLVTEASSSIAGPIGGAVAGLLVIIIIAAIVMQKRTGGGEKANKEHSITAFENPTYSTDIPESNGAYSDITGGYTDIPNNPGPTVDEGMYEGTYETPDGGEYDGFHAQAPPLPSEEAYADIPTEGAYADVSGGPPPTGYMDVTAGTGVSNPGFGFDGDEPTYGDAQTVYDTGDGDGYLDVNDGRGGSDEEDV